MPPAVKLNAIQVLGLSCFGLLLGNWLRRRWSVLDYLNIPGSILGGLVYALLMLALRDRWVNFELDLVLRDILMVAFFTTIGMSASVDVMKRGGPQVLLFFGVATVGAVLQNVVGAGGARLFGLDPYLGIVSGSVALTGGPATALAFGRTFEQLGVAGATTLGVSSAMFGIAAGGLLGGFIGGTLIRRHGLRPANTAVRVADPEQPAEQMVYQGEPPQEPVRFGSEGESGESALLHNVVLVGIAMGLGTIVSGFFERQGVTLPAYIGAMIVAAIIRNIDDIWRVATVSERHMDTIGNVALALFIVMAMLGLRLWELAHLAAPMFALLTLQVALVAVMCWGTYRVMGRDYEAAVMSGGFCGFMLGTTANAMACMNVLTTKYGPAPRAYIVVPLVGASLIDFTNAAVINAMMWILK